MTDTHDAPLFANANAQLDSLQKGMDGFAELFQAIATNLRQHMEQANDALVNQAQPEELEELRQRVEKMQEEARQSQATDAQARDDLAYEAKAHATQIADLEAQLAAACATPSDNVTMDLERLQADNITAWDRVGALEQTAEEFGTTIKRLQADGITAWDRVRELEDRLEEAHTDADADMAERLRTLENDRLQGELLQRQEEEAAAISPPGPFLGAPPPSKTAGGQDPLAEELSGWQEPMTITDVMSLMDVPTAEEIEGLVEEVTMREPAALAERRPLPPPTPLTDSPAEAVTIVEPAAANEPLIVSATHGPGPLPEGPRMPHSSGDIDVDIDVDIDELAEISLRIPPGAVGSPAGAAQHAVFQQPVGEKVQ